MYQKAPYVQPLYIQQNGVFMKFSNSDRIKLNTELQELEQVFKELFLKYPQRSLNLPHNLDDVRDILKEASEKSSDFLPQMFLNNTLKEDVFFQHGHDTEIYHHMRYLPTNWHSHSFLEVVCVIQGNCTNYIVEQELHMTEGDICIIAPDTSHAISAFTDDCIIFNIILRISTFEQAFFGTLSDNDILSDFFMRTLYHSQTHPFLYFRTGIDQELFDFVGYAYEEFKGKRQYRNRMINSIIDAFFITLLRNHGSDVIVPEIDTLGNDENIVFILKYIQEHYCTVTLKELSSFFNYSERQLQRIIKSSTGMSFSENILKMKMGQAARLLANPNLSIAAIAEELGYADSGNFRHIFKKYYAVTPMEYRENIFANR